MCVYSRNFQPSTCRRRKLQAGGSSTHFPNTKRIHSNSKSFSHRKIFQPKRNKILWKLNTLWARSPVRSSQSKRNFQFISSTELSMTRRRRRWRREHDYDRGIESMKIVEAHYFISWNVMFEEVGRALHVNQKAKVEWIIFAFSLWNGCWWLMTTPKAVHNLGTWATARVEWVSYSIE